HKNIKAKVENGVLTINIPKVSAESQAKAVKNIAIE
ncbi:MAG: Hsp20 family protein, partial [Bacteroidetes bacterium]|nr:Hsp20 family protein [Bacteroidota bacterium]